MTLRHWTQRQELLRLTSEPSIFWRIALRFSAEYASQFFLEYAKRFSAECALEEESWGGLRKEGHCHCADGADSGAFAQPAPLIDTDIFPFRQNPACMGTCRCIGIRNNRKYFQR